MIEHNYAVALYDSQTRIARAASRASFLSSLGSIEDATAPAPLSRRDYRPLTETVELRRPAYENATAA